MGTTPPPDAKQKLKTQLVIHLAIAGLVIVGGWVVYILAAAAGIDLLKGGGAPSETVQTVYLYLALTFTVLGGLYAWISSKRNADLLTRGVWIHGRVEKMSVLGKLGNKPITFAYDVAGTTYRKKKDVPKEIHSTYSAGTRIWVVYDPKSPKRCELLLSPV